MNNIIYWLLQNNELKDVAGSRVVMDLVNECFQLNMAGSEVNRKTLIAQCSNHSERDIKEALDIYFKIKPMLNDLVSKIPVSIDLYLQSFKLGMTKIFMDSYAKIHKTDQETFKGGICQAICNDFLIFFLPKFTLGSFFLSFSYFRS